ncbi:MAG: hypothetical protein K9K67_05930 [Bacteriovoracaceae bacterium]|nr:hypothetical protein [Bacteriovoracaceae bacterium]
MANLSAQEPSVEGNIFDYTKKVHSSLKDLKSLGATEYFKEIDNYRSDLEKYFDQKKRVCEGEFSTVILNGVSKNEKENKPLKLKPEERKLCFRELKALQLTFINNMYVARKRYLEYLHGQRIKELDISREQAVKSLQDSFNKRNRR